MSPFLFRNTFLARTRPILSRSFVLRPDLSLTDSTPPFNLHINPTRRNWRVFKRADLEFFRRCDAVPHSITQRSSIVESSCEILPLMSMIVKLVENRARVDF